MNLPWKEFAGILNRFLRRIFQPATTRNFHSNDRYTLNVIVRNDLCQFLTVISFIKFWTADQCHFIFDKFQDNKFEDLTNEQADIIISMLEKKKKVNNGT